MTVSLPFASESSQSLGYGDYLRLSKLVREWCGLHFSDKRRTDLERGIRQAFAASTCTNLDEYYHLLQDPSNGVVHMERLVNALTVGETHFFRDAAQFEILCNHVLPQVIERRRELRTLRIWSAGCASGEEPYSIAIVLRELLPDVDEWSITILGTDINTEALDRARKAVYGEWAFREERAKQWQSMYFRHRNNRYELIPEVRRMVTLARLNLKNDRFPAYETNTTLMDLILCRNVMMYFTDTDAGRIIEQFYHALTDGGWMLVGHAEHSLVTYHRFQVHTFPNAIMYRRSDQLPYMPKDWHWLAPPPKVDEPSEPDVSASVPEAAPEAAGTPPEGQASQESLQAEPPTDADPVQHARELLDYGHSERARALLLEVVAQKPRHALACTLLGRAYANLGYWQEAEKWCRQAVHLDRLALDAYYTLALVLQHQGMLQDAIDAMRKVIYIDRRSVLGHFGLADLYHSNGQLPLALKSLDNALRLLETYPEKELIPGSGGITAGGLRGAIVGQQQRWSAEAGPPQPGIA